MNRIRVFSMKSGRFCTGYVIEQESGPIRGYTMRSVEETEQMLEKYVKRNNGSGLRWDRGTVRIKKVDE